MNRLVFLAILLVSSIYLTLLPGLGAPTAIQPLDLFEFEYVLDPQISPDGRKIVYLRRYSDVQTDERYSNVWLINSDGTGHRPLTTGQFHDGSPKWSPDGTRPSPPHGASWATPSVVVDRYKKNDNSGEE
jgi:acylaminoacyl-peptidase